MKREFTYTKERLLFILEDLLSRDIHGGPRYQVPENVEEGFEKRATLEFLLWFLAEAFPDGMSFHCSFDDLEEDYSQALARVIEEGKGWAARHVCEKEQAENVVFVDFRKP